MEDSRGPGAVESVHHCQLKSIEILNSQDQVGPVYLQPLEQKPNVVVGNVLRICVVFGFHGLNIPSLEKVPRIKHMSNCDIHD